MPIVELNSQVHGEGEALLGIHGIFGSGDNLRLLNQLPFQVHLPDLRNHGGSPKHCETSLLAMSHDILAYLDKLKINKTHILGHSLGARLAMFVAMNFPDRINKFIAVDIAPRAYPFTQKTIFEVIEKVELSDVRTRQEANDILAEEIDQVSVRQFILKSLQRLPSGKFSWKIGWRQLRNNYTAWSCSPVENDQIYYGEGALIFGMNSTFVDLKDHALIRKHFPNLEIIGIDKAGHWVHTEQPQRFLHELQRILLS